MPFKGSHKIACDRKCYYFWKRLKSLLTHRPTIIIFLLIEDKNLRKITIIIHAG